jgi:hypothetical protein
MFCRKCGTGMPDDSQFCLKCGQSVATSEGRASATGTAAAVAPARIPIRIAAPRPKRNIAAWILGCVFLSVFLLLVVVWVGVQVIRHSQLSAQSSASQERPPQLHKQTTGNVAFTISAGGASNYKFTVPAMASNVTMKGHFAATGGFGNDIEVFVCAEDGFVNWQNGHGTKTFYNSGHVTQDSVNISLPSDPATYYVVFSNKASLLTPRAVEASIDLNYYTPAGWFTPPLDGPAGADRH